MEKTVLFILCIHLPNTASLWTINISAKLYPNEPNHPKQSVPRIVFTIIQAFSIKWLCF